MQIGNNERSAMLKQEGDIRYIKFTPDQLQALADLYRAGQSTHNLAKRYGISPTTVGRRLVAMGVELRPLRGNRIATDQVLDAARRMRQDGLAWRAVVKATGVRDQSIMAAMRRQRAKSAQVE